MCMHYGSVTLREGEAEGHSSAWSVELGSCVCSVFNCSQTLIPANHDAALLLHVAASAFFA